VVIRHFDSDRREAGTLTLSDGDGSVEMVSCGRPPAKTSVVIVDPDTLTPVGEGTIGEIWVAGHGVSPGYYRRPEATAETFGHSLPGYDGLYMRTGDLAAFVDGELYITGRLKDMIIIRGRNIYPQDIEAMAQTLSPAIGIGAAFELEGHPSTVGIVCEVDDDAREAAGLSYSDLTAQLQKTLMAYFSLPSLAVAFLPSGRLPRTGAGKVTRRPTRSSLENGDLPLVHAVGFAATVPVAVP
jgi:acyl-CoA synthetase (AMP-forming)/AMP-acid ligase II